MTLRVARKPGPGWIAVLPLYAATAVLTAGAIYFGAALGLGSVSVNSDFRASPDGIDVYLWSNGVHADLVVPIEAADVNWLTRLPLGALVALPGATDLAFGWGDRAFYLATPTWRDLRVSTALWALTGLDTTVLHVEAVTVPEGSYTRHLRLSVAQYQRLAAYIENGFRRDSGGQVIIVPGAHYSGRDAFFEAEGRYSAFRTCNEWAREALATAGVRVPVWSPFDTALLHQLPTEP